MNWKNLLDKKCPKCGSELEKRYALMLGRRYACTILGCNFFIPEVAFERRVKELRELS